MRVLLSAYACEPNKGSEPGVGWNWAAEIANRGHDVWVLTRTNNKSSIENGSYNRTKITFIYYDLPSLFIYIKKFIGINIYYIFWQIGAAFFVKRIDREVDFNIIHHITFGSFRSLSYIPFLIKKTFIFGPVGGGERSPIWLRKDFGFKNNLIDLFRDIINCLVFINPLYYLLLFKSSLILVKTKETYKFIPKCFRYKTIIRLEIGVDKNDFELLSDTVRKESTESISLLFVGRFIFWKAPHLVLKAFSIVQKIYPNSKLTMIGKGDFYNKLKDIEMISNLKNISWISWLPQTDLFKHYRQKSIFVFPSLHDSSGNVVLEALSYGLPVVCLNLGGPSAVLGNNISTAVNVYDLTQEQVVKSIADQIIKIISDEQYYYDLSYSSLNRANELTWQNTIGSVYSILEHKYS